MKNWVNWTEIDLYEIKCQFLLKVSNDAEFSPSESLNKRCFWTIVFLLQRKQLVTKHISSQKTEKVKPKY